MTIAFLQLFGPTVVSGVGLSTLYTLPALPTQIILRNGRVRFSNTTAGAVTIQAYAVPSGGTAVVGNEFLPPVSVPANSYIDVDVPVMAAGGILQAQAGAATSITATCLDGFLQS